MRSLPLSPSPNRNCAQIVELMLKDVYRSGQYQNIQIDVAEEVKDYLAETGYDAKYGARPLRRLIQRTIEDEIAEAFLRGSIGAGDTIVLSLTQEQKIEIKKSSLPRTCKNLLFFKKRRGCIRAAHSSLF